MPGHQLTIELIETAKSDLKALDHMLDEEAFDDRVFGFHAQQAIEKALKAWLNLLGHPHIFTHDLGRLLFELEQCDAEVASY